MKMTMRIHSLLALLFLGSASIMAQDGDPFGEVNTTKYSNTMTITGYVRMNGEVLGNETVVAVYQGDELRGKNSPKDYGSYLHVLMLTIHGDTKGEALHFKVYTGGRVIEVDQGLTYVTDQHIGKVKSPYYIDLPPAVVTTPSTEGWATTCLPFNAKVPDGVTVYNATAIADGELKITPVTGTILPASVPVLLKSEGLDKYEWTSLVADGDITTEGNIFTGTTADTDIASNTVLTLGHSTENSEIGFWLFTGTTIPANRAYIANPPSNVRGLTFSIEDDPTGIVSTTAFKSSRTYDLQGREIPSGRLRSHSLVIKDGRKYLVK